MSATSSAGPHVFFSAGGPRCVTTPTSRTGIRDLFETCADEARQRAEKLAFGHLVDELEQTWAGVYQSYAAGPVNRPAMNPAAAYGINPARNDSGDDWQVQR